jgi:hypothetical protein
MLIRTTFLTLYHWKQIYWNYFDQDHVLIVIWLDYLDKCYQWDSDNYINVKNSVLAASLLGSNNYSLSYSLRCIVQGYPELSNQSNCAKTISISQVYANQFMQIIICIICNWQLKMATNSRTILFQKGNGQF